MLCCIGFVSDFCGKVEVSVSLLINSTSVSVDIMYVLKHVYDVRCIVISQELIQTIKRIIANFNNK